MNLPRKTVFWVITLVAISGAFYLIDEKAEDIKIAEEANLRLFSFEPEDVVGFWISSKKEGLRAKVTKDGKEWKLIKPHTAKADNDAIEKTLKNIIKARKDAVLFENPEPDKLKELGLDTPELEMGLKTKSGVTVIQFGNKGPTHNVSYAMLKGDSRVYRIHSDIKEEADKGTHELRDKTILDFDPVKLRRMELERKDKERVVIEHDKGRWNMLEPDKTRAGMSSVLETLYKIKNSEIKVFVVEKAADLTSYGLVSPKIKLSILEKEKNSAHVLLIGAKDRVRRGYFAKLDSSEAVFVIEEEVVNSLLVNSDVWKE